MPREFVHWKVLDDIIQSPNCDSKVCSNLISAAKKFPAVARIGAMAHDAPYFHRGGASDFILVAETLHGTNSENTFEPLRTLWDLAQVSVSNHRRELLSALLLGMLSHLTTDAVFHPIVYFFSGDYNADNLEQRRIARTKHRLFETWLDNLLINISSPQTSIKQALHRIPQDDLNFLCSSLASTTPLHPYSQVKLTNVWRQSFRHMAIITWATRNDLTGSIFRTLADYFGGWFTEVEAISSYKRKSRRQSLEQELCYLCPVTGLEKHSEIPPMLEESASFCRSLLDSLPENFLLGYGPSLNFGLPHISPNQGVYFAPNDTWKALGMS